MKTITILFLKIRLPMLILGIGVFTVCLFLVAPKAHAQTLEQLSYRFYVNENAQTPTDPWPIGATDLAENAAITKNDDPPQSGDVIRIRMTASVAGDPVSAGTEFKLQYAEGTVCSTIQSFNWTDVSGIKDFLFGVIN